MVDAMLKSELGLLRNDVKLLSQSIQCLSDEIGALKGAIITLVDRKEKNNVLKRLERKR